MLSDIIKNNLDFFADVEPFRSSVNEQEIVEISDGRGKILCYDPYFI